MHWANNYVGLPYDRFNFNCWHFFKKVQAEQFDNTLPVINVDPKDRKSLIGAFKTNPAYDGWVKVDEPREGDAVMMGGVSLINHIGIYIDVGYAAVLHCDDRIGVVITHVSDFDNAQTRKILKFMRPKMSRLKVCYECHLSKRYF